MEKPVKKVLHFYHYKEVMRYIEEKYDIKVNDYGNTDVQFEHWRTNVVNEPIYGFHPCGPKNNPWCIWNNSGPSKLCTEEEYKEQKNKHLEQLNRFREWQSDNYLPVGDSFWRWMLYNGWEVIDNDSYETLYVKKLMSELKQDDWQFKILELIYKEFHEDEMVMWIEYKGVVSDFLYDLLV